MSIRRHALESAEAKWQQQLQQQPGGCVFESFTLGWLNVLLRVGACSTQLGLLNQLGTSHAAKPAFCGTSRIYTGANQHATCIAAGRTGAGVALLGVTQAAASERAVACSEAASY